MSWSVPQLQMLEAMGLQVMVRAPSGAPVHERTPLPVAPALAAASTPASPAPATVIGGRDAGEHAGLAHALWRAAGGGDLAGLVDDLARLRREPALKRALWPRLRTLRRSH